VGCLLALAGAVLIFIGIVSLAEGSGLVGTALLGLGFLLLWWGLRRRRKVIRTPEALTRHILEHYHEVTEQDIGRCEMEVKRARGRHPDSDLLYALRVSKCVPTLKTLKTLASRWSTANCGAGASGLQMGQSSKNWEAVNDFLASLYRQRLDDLYAEIVAKARESVSKRKSAQAKLNVVEKALERIHSAQAEFMYELPGLAAVIDKWTEELEGIAEQTEAGKS